MDRQSPGGTVGSLLSGDTPNPPALSLCHCSRWPCLGWVVSRGAPNPKCSGICDLSLESAVALSCSHVSLSAQKEDDSLLSVGLTGAVLPAPGGFWGVPLVSLNWAFIPTAITAFVFFAEFSSCCSAWDTQGCLPGLWV